MSTEPRVTRRDALLTAGVACSMAATSRLKGADADDAVAKTPLLDRLDGLPVDQRRARIMELIQTQRDEFFRELRAARPIYATGDLVLVALYPDVVEALSHPSVLTVKLYEPKMGSFMLAQDETTINWRDKGLMQGLINPDDADRVRAIVRTACDWSLMAADSATPYDIVKHFTRAVPLAVVNEYFGFVNDDAEAMLRWSRLSQYDNFHNHPFHGLPNAEEIHQQAETAKEEMKNYVAALVPRRAMELQQHPERDDVLSRMLKCRFPSSLGFDGARMVINTIGTLIGAIETTSHAVVHIVDQLLNRDAELSAAETAAQSDDRDTLSDITFEALRFNPISPYMYRLAVAEHTLAAGTTREHIISPGQTVLALTLSAMFDEAVIPSTSHFLRTGRPWSHYFHFGYGHHRCLGEHVAKVMIPEMIGRLVLKGHLCRPSGPAGTIDYAGGPFPESFSVLFA